jgi:hypothetical protein
MKAMVEKFRAGPLNTGGGVHRLQYEEEDTIWIQYKSAFSGTGVMNRKALVPRRSAFCGAAGTPHGACSGEKSLSVGSGGICCMVEKASDRSTWR